MRCDTAQRTLSAWVDGTTDAALDDVLAHRDGCTACAAFERHARRVRRDLRLVPVGSVPDVASAVLERIDDGPADLPRDTRGLGRGPGPRNWLGVAAAFLVGVVIGAGTVAQLRRPDPAPVALPERVLAAQAALSGLDASLAIEEHGWHRDVPVRHYDAELRYRAPETLVLTIDDRTSYPGPAWRPNDRRLVVSPEAVWSEARPACPVEHLPACLPSSPRVTGVADPMPFTETVALDLVVPVDSLALGGDLDPIGTRRIAGRPATGVATTAAQVRPLLDAVMGTGTWREIHPSDRVELWLDDVTFVPLDVVVRAVDDRFRADWAARRGYPDVPGDRILRITVTDLRLDPEPGLVVPAPPAGSDLAGASFRDGPTSLPEVSVLPAGLTPHRTGTITLADGTPVEVGTWTDGRAWLRLLATDAWRGERLFGGFDDVIRRVQLTSGEVLYTGAGGTRVAVHAADLDVVVEGSLPPATLLEVAAGLDVHGEPIPSTWSEAATTLSDAAAAVPGLLAPVGLEGFGPPGARVRDGIVTLAYVGPGERSFLLIEEPGDALPPPRSADVVGVEVRGRPGRFTPETGELEWVEDGLVVIVRSRSVGVGELLEIAATLERR